MREQYIPEEASFSAPPEIPAQVSVRAKRNKKTKETEDPESRQERVKASLTDLGFDYDPGLSLDQNERRVNVFKYFIDKGLISRNDQGFVFDSEGLKHFLYAKHNGEYVGKFNKGDLMNAFLNVKAVDKKDLEGSAEGQTVDEKTVMALPKSLDDLFGKYTTNDLSNHIFEPWEFTRNPGKETVNRNRWISPVMLESGETTTLAEMALTKKLLVDFKVRRNKDGKLEMWDSKKELFVPISIDKLGAAFNVSYRNSSGESVMLRQKQREFLNTATPNIVKRGIVKATDIRTMGNSKESHLMGTHERSLTKSTSVGVSLTNMTCNLAARYYLGREKIVGTDIEIGDNTILNQVDNDTVLIAQVVHGKTKPVAFFKLLNEEELVSIRNKTKERYAERGIELKGAAVTNRTIIDGKIMKGRVKPYQIDKVVFRRADEGPEEYGRRISELNDFDFVKKISEEFFTGTGVGLNQLPWGEQLLVARAILEEKDPARLRTFVSEFGVNGLRSLTSADYSKDHVNAIISLSEQNPNYAKKLFARYRRLVDLVTDIVSKVDLKNADIPTDLKDRLPYELKEAFLRRAADLLDVAKDIKPDTSPSEKEHIRVFKGLNVLLAIIKEWISSGKEYDFSTLGSQGSQENGARFRAENTASEEQYELKIFIRPKQEGTAEARINFELNFDTEKPNKKLQKLFKQQSTIISNGKTKTYDQSVLRVGLDLSDAKGDHRLSLDLGRNSIENEKIQRTGDVLAKILALHSDRGSHTEEPFSDYSQDFEEIANAFLKVLKQKKVDYLHPHQRPESIADQKL